jgi:hypothetical protein
MKNKYQVTFTFPTEELLEEFCGYISDGGGAYNFVEFADPDSDAFNAHFNYSRCFPAYGWKEGESKFIDVEIIEEENE